MNEIYNSPVDPNGGFLCFTVYWYPKAGLPEADGEKMRITSFIPVVLDEPCLCGSGKTYGACCRRKRYWHLICRDPGLPGAAGYSVVKSQVATFTPVEGKAVRARLMDDVRLHCSHDGPEQSFWIYQGNPALKSPRGVMCFGNIELQQQRTLEVTAMSDIRMRILLDVVEENCGDLLGNPTHRYDPMQVLDKRTGTYVDWQPGPSSPQT